MKFTFSALVVAPFLIGCASSQPTTAPVAVAPTAVSSAPVKLTATQELAKYCRVCVVDKGEKIEEFFPSRLDTKRDGKTYKFCSDDCKKKFDANAKRYAVR